MPVRTVTAQAKLNLSLRITGVREDGYHLLESIMHQVQWGDTLRVEYDPQSPDHTLLRVTPPIVPDGPDNLAHQAVRLLRAEAGLSGTVRLLLRKRIPVGAGLGGGSSDAAAVLRTLNELAGLGLDEQALSEIGLRLGADVPFALHGGAALVQGIGQVVSPLRSVLNIPVLLVHPDQSLSTPEVYSWWDNRQGRTGVASNTYPTRLQASRPRARAGVDPKTRALSAALQEGYTIVGAESPDWAGLLVNDLEEVVCDRVPEIAHALERLRRSPEVLGAALTGTGSTVFGLLHPGARYARLLSVLGSQYRLTLTYLKTQNSVPGGET